MDSSVTLFDIIYLLLYINAVIIIVLLIGEERDPDTTLAWTLTLLLLPFVGLIAYFLFGRNWRRLAGRDKRRAQAVFMGSAFLAPLYERWSQEAEASLADMPSFARRLATAIERQNAARPLPCTDLSIFVAGRDKFDALLEDIAGATSSIHLEYFIWGCDELTERVCAALAEKAAAGVEVRVLYDWVGSAVFSKRQLRTVAAAGGHVKAGAAHVSRLNYRNHHKIAVIDGAVGYTGGMNMGAEYIHGGKRYRSWRDTHVRFTGPLVAELQRMFAERWYRMTGESLFVEQYFPGSEVDGPYVLAQVAHSGPETALPALRNAFMLAIAGAESRVWIQSPYYVPDEALAEILCSQALAGVDVRFMMTGVPDKRIAWNAAFSYIDELVRAGGHLYHYDEGFFHPKTMAIDGTVAVIGTTNFDIRSFMLHDELSVFFYDSGTARKVEDAFRADETASHEITMESYEDFSAIRTFGNALARLWSRLL